MIQLEPATRSVVGAKGAKRLSCKQFILLQALTEADAQGVSDAVLQALVRGHGFTCQAATLRSNVRDIREKLVAAGYPYYAIARQESGLGYRLVGNREPVVDRESRRIAQLARGGAKYIEIAAATGRPLGTIKTVTSRLRDQGRIAPRYVVCIWHPEWTAADVGQITKPSRQL